jgi:hypothetical protein
MSLYRKHLGWFLAGAIAAGAVGTLDLELLSRAWADEVPVVPSDKTHQPNTDVVYDETWEAAEFLAVPRKMLDPPGLPVDGVQIKLVSSPLGILAGAAAGFPVAAAQITNSIPLRFFSRDEIWDPDNGLWGVGDDRPSAGYAGLLFPTGAAGLASTGMPVVTKWRVTGHIHSQE